MTRQSETDAILMANWANSTVEDLERGIVNFDRWAREASIDYTHRAKSRELGHMADLLRAELKRRQEGVGKVTQNETPADYRTAYTGNEADQELE